MNMRKIIVLAVGAGLAGAAFGQDKPDDRQQQQPKASAQLKLRAAGAARTATGLKDGQQADPQVRRERVEKVAAGLQKKTNETANAAASNVK